MRIQREIVEKYVNEVAAGEVIFSEGDPGSHMYVIVDGEIEISKRTSSDSSKTLITLKKGDIFGEMAILEHKTRSATATATVQSRLLVMNEALFSAMVKSNPDFASKMIRTLCERLRKANTTIQELTTTNRENQIHEGLLDYAEKFGLPTFKGMRVNIKEFSAWAARHLGIHPKHIPAVLRTFQANKLIFPSASGKQEMLVDRRGGVAR